MKEFKKDIISRLTDIPTTLMGFAIIIAGLTLVYLGKITMQDFTGFMIIALPFFFLKKESKSNDTKE